MKSKKYLLNSLILSVLIILSACDQKPAAQGGSYCGNPAPLKGQFDPKAPGYIIVFKDDVNVAAEVERLKRNFEIQVGHIFDSALNGFSATMTDDTREKLRCETSINYIQYDSSITLSSE